MTSLVLVVVPGIGALALTPEALREAQARGRELLPDPAGAVQLAAQSRDVLLSPEELEERTGIPARWWLDQAREHRVPHRRIGKRVRFDFAEVMASDAVKRRGNGS